MRLDIKWYQYAVIDRFKFNACDHCEDGKVVFSFVPQCTKLHWKKHTEQWEEQRQIISSLHSGDRGSSDFRKIQIQSGPDHSGDREKQERQYAFSFMFIWRFESPAVSVRIKTIIRIMIRCTQGEVAR